MAAGNRPTGSGEDRLIDRYFRPLAQHPGAFGLIDDAATYTPPPGQDLVLTVDAIVAGVHFFPDDPPDLVARKALRVNLSDLAAKGATPAGFLLTTALPKGTGEAWLSDFAQGLAADIEEFDCPLFGGDTVSTPGPITISVTAFGLLPEGTAVRRRGAKPGDVVVVSGAIGDAVLGLALRGRDVDAVEWPLDDDERLFLMHRYLLPQPRLELAEIIRLSASAAMDVSDGLAGDLAKLCAASGVDAVIDLAAVPLSIAARIVLSARPSLIEKLISGGDDYEILATVPADKFAALQEKAKTIGVPITKIGEIKDGTGQARFLDPDGKVLDLAQTSFSHF